MPSTALYTDASRIVLALAFQSPETLNAAANAGAVSIALNTAPPADWQVGSTLVLDAANPQLRESVTITAPPNGTTIPVSALVNSHVAGAPVVNATIAANYVAPASRWFETLTYTPGGFLYEQVTDTKEGYIDQSSGLLVVPLSKPRVVIADITSVQFQSTPVDIVETFDVTKAWIRGNYMLEIAPPHDYYRPSGMATVTYKGGFNPMPEDITHAATVLAARMYKVRDSGYSDVIGSADTGVFQYKKAIPQDIVSIVQKYRRWTE